MRSPSAGSVHVLFVGPAQLIGAMAPSDGYGLRVDHLLADGPDGLLLPPPASPQARAEVTVVLEPLSYPAAELERLPGTTLGVLTERGGAHEEGESRARALDRVVSFDPALTGQVVAGAKIWRAIAPPVSDRLFADVRPLHGRPRAMSIGSWSEHREAILMPVKHRHDLMQVIHGVSGEELVRLLGEYDVGVYVPRRSGAGFAQQVAMHLAAGQLLLSGSLAPSHGLEQDIDYLYCRSSEALVWVLDRIARFPEMYQRIRVRGRMKAEQFRASLLFARILQDLMLDVAVFGAGRARSGA